MEELYKEYNADETRHQAEVRAWLAIPGKRGLYNGVPLDYGKYSTRIAEIIKADNNLSDKQVGYIMGIAYDKYHSHFGDMFFGAQSIAEMMVNYPKD